VAPAVAIDQIETDTGHNFMPQLGDSEPEAEFQETVNQSKAMLNSWRWRRRLPGERELYHGEIAR
jgi:hypothetical protein